MASRKGHPSDGFEPPESEETPPLAEPAPRPRSGARRATGRERGNSNRAATVLRGLPVEEVPIDHLRPDPANPRRISKSELDALTRSLQTFGFLVPVVARREDGLVVSGHQRLVAARRLDLQTVPVIFVDLPAHEARLLGLALNRISGEWDKPLVAQELKDLSGVPGLDLLLSGFVAEEISSYLKLLEAQEKRDRLETIDLDQALRLAYEHPRARRGDLFVLGDHRLLCGDATSEKDVGRLMGGRRAALGLTDPPYNVSLGDHGGRQRGGSRRRLANDSLTPEAFEAFCRAFALRLIENLDGGLYIFMSSKELPTLSRVLSDLGAHWSDTIIWRKDNFVLGRAPYQRAYEPCWFGWPEKAKPYWAGGRKQADVWEIPRPNESPLHPTQKPVELLERAIRNSSRSGDIVLDPFLGSGSTLIACERTGRLSYSLEIDSHYASLTVARWEAFTGKKAVKVPE